MMVTVRQQLFPGHTNMAFDVAEFATAARDILTPERDLGPKRLAVIEVLAMTEFVNDHIPSKVQWKELELVMEIEIPLRRTAPPAALRVLDRYPAIRHPDTESFSLYHWY